MSRHTLPKSIIRTVLTAHTIVLVLCVVSVYAADARSVCDSYVLVVIAAGSRFYYLEIIPYYAASFIL